MFVFVCLFVFFSFCCVIVLLLFLGFFAVVVYFVCLFQGPHLFINVSNLVFTVCTVLAWCLSKVVLSIKKAVGKSASLIGLLRT